MKAEEIIQEAYQSGYTIGFFLDDVREKVIARLTNEIKQHINQRVIEELERLITMQGDLVPKYGDIIYERDVKQRIKELKQEQI